MLTTISTTLDSFFITYPSILHIKSTVSLGWFFWVPTTYVFLLRNKKNIFLLHTLILRPDRSKKQTKLSRIHVYTSIAGDKTVGYSLTILPPLFFCPEKVVCFLRLLHIFKCTFIRVNKIIWSLIRLLPKAISFANDHTSCSITTVTRAIFVLVLFVSFDALCLSQ